MSNPNFKLFSRPCAIACIDDDISFLDLLSIALPDDWNVHLFTHTKAICEALNLQGRKSKQDIGVFAHALESKDNDEHPIVKLIHYWQQNVQRWDYIEIALVDYAMPKMTGIQLLASLPQWTGSNILLTGVADEVIAVQAFNQGLIHNFIPKQTENVFSALTQTVLQLQVQAFKPYQLLCETALSAEQNCMLQDKEAQLALSQFASGHWVEYIVLPEPFGILGLSNMGQLSWLQLERTNTIEDLKEIALANPWDQDSLERLHGGTAISNCLLRQALNNQIKPCIAPITPLSSSGLIAAHFEFEMLQSNPASLSYKQWLKSNSKRTVRAQ